MRVKLRLFRDGSFVVREYELEVDGNPTVLELLYAIKEKDPTLSFRSMCRASICGTCALKVNGEHRLACNTRVSGEEVLIEPADGYKPIRDLVVEHESLFESMKSSKVWLSPGKERVKLYPEDLSKTSKAWDCILCGICNSVCPPLNEGKDFGGPSLLTKLYSITEDKRDSLREERLEEVLKLNVSACVHCSNCNLFCPKGCMPERWISLFESKLQQRGYIQKKEEDFGFLGF